MKITSKFGYPDVFNADAEPLKINESTNLGTQFTKQGNVAAILPTCALK